MICKVKSNPDSEIILAYLFYLIESQIRMWQRGNKKYRNKMRNNMNIKNTKFQVCKFEFFNDF